MEYVLNQREISTACASWIVMQHGLPSKGIMVDAIYELIPDPENPEGPKDLIVRINLKRKQDMPT